MFHESICSLLFFVKLHVVLTTNMLNNFIVVSLSSYTKIVLVFHITTTLIHQMKFISIYLNSTPYKNVELNIMKIISKIIKEFSNKVLVNFIIK